MTKFFALLSGSGGIERMANAVAEVAREAGVSVECREGT